MVDHDFPRTLANNKMNHTYKPHFKHYWFRVWSLVIGFLVVAIIPAFLPTSSSPLPFQIMIAVFAVLTLLAGIYIRPKHLVVTISDTDFVIKDGMERVVYSSQLSELESVGLGRWGQILGYQIGWVCIKTTTSDKTRYVGSVCGYAFKPAMYLELAEDFHKAKNLS